MHVHIAQVNSVLYNGEATALTVPGVDGQMTILPHHVALISTLKAGMVTVQFEGGNEVFTIVKGIVEVSGNKVTVLLTE